METFNRSEIDFENKGKDKRVDPSTGLKITYEQVLHQYQKGTIDEWIQRNKNGKKGE